jgi:hypothetical protein
MDAAWATRALSTLGVAINDRAGGFRDPLAPLAWPGWRGRLVFGDVDGDGHLDALGPFSNPSSVHLVFGVGDGTFANFLDVATDNSFVDGLALGDLDGDRRADLVSASRRVTAPALVVQVVSKIGDGQRKATYTLDDVSDLPLSTLIDDLDGDGDQDVLVAGYNNSFVFLNNGTGVLGASTTYPIAAPVVVADFDGDGRVDLYGRDSAGPAILFGRQSGGFADPQVLQSDRCGNSTAAVAGDVNGDDRPDLVCSGTSVYLLLNLGRGTFGDAKELIGIGDVSAILDWDHDGDADIVADGGTTIFFNDDGALPEGPVSDANLLSGWGWASSVELNGDGVRDLLLLSQTALSTRLSGSDGALGPEARVINHALSGPPGVGDIDGDGRPDLVVPYSDPSGRIGVALNDGKGRFGTETFSGAGPYPTAAEVVDLNRDGKNDVVTLVAPGVSVILNDGRSGFPTHVDYSLGDVRAFTTGDVDGDGAPDVVAVGPDGTYVSRNQGDGTLAAAVSYPHGGWPPARVYPEPSSALTLVDLNGDDRPEIALALAGDIIVHRNNGDGTFGTLLPIFGRNPGISDDPLMPRNLVAGDLNGDSLPDLVALYGSNTTRTFLSDGKGNLWRGQVYALSPTPAAVAMGDLNGDGRVDLSVSAP